eukprot:1109917-Pyramimonas_sp.AAC.1
MVMMLVCPMLVSGIEIWSEQRGPKCPDASSSGHRCSDRRDVGAPLLRQSDTYDARTAQYTVLVPNITSMVFNMASMRL